MILSGPVRSCVTRSCVIQLCVPWWSRITQPYTAQRDIKRLQMFKRPRIFMILGFSRLSRFVISLMLLSSTPAQSVARPDVSSAQTPSEGSGACAPLTPSDHFKVYKTLELRERPPQPDHPRAPVVIGLHGLGHHKLGFSQLARSLPKTWRIVWVDAPLRYRRGFA